MKTNKEVLSSIIKTVQMGQCGIRCVQEQATGKGLKQALHDQLTEYDAIEQQAYDLATRRGWLLEPLDAGVERFSSMMARMQLMGNNRDSKIAKMLVQGNTRGMILGMKNLRRGKRAESDVRELTQKLIDQEKAGIKASQQFL
jgi:hypothetical protein